MGGSLTTAAAVPQISSSKTHFLSCPGLRRTDNLVGSRKAGRGQAISLSEPLIANRNTIVPAGNLWGLWTPCHKHNLTEEGSLLREDLADQCAYLRHDLPFGQVCGHLRRPLAFRC